MTTNYFSLTFSSLKKQINIFQLVLLLFVIDFNQVVVEEEEEEANIIQNDGLFVVLLLLQGESTASFWEGNKQK